MWVNHLCLISEFRDVEEYIKKNLVTDKFSCYPQRGSLMVQSFVH